MTGSNRPAAIFRNLRHYYKAYFVVPGSVQFDKNKKFVYKRRSCVKLQISHHCMTSENIKALLYQTEKQMYGFNYEVTLGIEVFENCYSLQDVNNAIKTTFPSSNPEAITPVRISTEDFWDDVNDKFNYRGHNFGVSLELDEKQERELKEKQNQIGSFVSQYIKEGTEIYSYPFLEGIPGYPVFWEYTFVVLNTEGACVFFYGSSSD
jgi:hypothetical protein